MLLPATGCQESNDQAATSVSPQPATAPNNTPPAKTPRQQPTDSEQPSNRYSLEKLPSLLPQQRLEDGWLMLFDGQTLFGWEVVGKADWNVVRGTIVSDAAERGFLRTTTPFADYELELEYQAPDETNSGIFLHTGTRPRSPKDDCYELNIAPADNPFPTGSFVQRLRVDEKQRIAALKATTNGWHHYHVTVNGGRVTVKLNGVPVLDYNDPSPLARGYIALQHNSGLVSFRNIRIRPLNLKPLTNGKDLAGWRTHPKLKGKFSVTAAGELRVQGGRGQLESEAEFGDFVLQLQAKTSGVDMNSGVFFRCIPRDVMMGYESQIHHGLLNLDRTRPQDCGTGGIFRRQDARIVASEDGKWFTKTIVATGNHFAIWVNGLQVTDWTDQRKPDPNPRRGLRTTPGTIMLQAHDPTTDVYFRKLQATELPPRHSPQRKTH